MLDVSRDPRWGRIAEGRAKTLSGSIRAGENSRLQGERLGDRGALAATAKHFCAGGAATAERDYAASMSPGMLKSLCRVSRRRRSGCAAIMSAFNNVSSVPMTSHGKLLNGYCSVNSISTASS
jgi:beta-glucosidase